MNSKLLKLSGLLMLLTGATAAQAQNVPPSEFPEARLLYAQNAAAGYTAESASHFCDVYKQIYQRDYFVVYCVFRDEIRNEIRYDIETRTGYQFLGYETNESSAGGGYDARGVYLDRRTGPVYIPIEQDVWVPYLDRFTIVHLEVWGLGKLSEMPWKRVFTSLDPKDGMLPPIVYADADDARLRCALTLGGLQRNPAEAHLYRYARCQVVSAPEGYGYEIQAKTPFFSER